MANHLTDERAPSAAGRVVRVQGVVRYGAFGVSRINLA
jgi:hypothetical protein